MKNQEVIKILENMRDQKIVAVTDAYSALDQAIKLLKTYPDFCDMCWTSSWAPAPKGTPNAQKVKGKAEYVICQMCEADRRLKNGKN